MSKTFYNLTYSAILITFISCVGYYIYDQYTEIANPCEAPLRYSIGEVDARFGLEKPELYRAVLAAEAIWEEATGREVFIYDPEATLKVHFRFDDRQERTNTVQEKQEEISQKQEIYEEQEESINKKNQSYEQRIAEYEIQALQYKKELDNYNAQVDELNARDNVSKEEVDAIKEKQKELEKQFANLEEKRVALNQVVKDLQGDIDQINTFGEEINTDAKEFNQSFGGAHVFDQGEFTGTAINIYEYKKFDDLVLVIAHELAHARGLGHVNDTSAIMSEIYDEQAGIESRVTQADLDELERACNPFENK